MSYSRRFSRTVAVPYSGSVTVSYPASQSGGSTTVHYSGTAHEVVEVDIHVDTTPFDSSIAHCNDRVNGLTASVGTMNAAQCVAIAQNAEKVSQTLIDGFFHTVRTDLSTQKAELEQVINARLLLLRQQVATLREKQQAMTDDYARTTARYQKLFGDLNNELSLRIHEIDRPVFDFVKEIDAHSDRMLHTDMVQTAVTMSRESGILQAQISAATVKRHALEAMSQARSFLLDKARSERTIHDSRIEGAGDERYLIPVCYMRTESEHRQVERKCIVPDYYAAQKAILEARLCEVLDNVDLEDTSEAEATQLRSFLQSEIAANITGDDRHSVRVREMINRMSNK